MLSNDKLGKVEQTDLGFGSRSEATFNFAVVPDQEPDWRGGVDDATHLEGQGKMLGQRWPPFKWTC